MSKEQLRNCPSCETEGVLPTQDNKCPHCRADLANAPHTYEFFQQYKEEKVPITNVHVKCKKCGGIYNPQLSSRKKWVCTSCQGKNPNLKVQYRSVANLYIIGLLSTALLIFASFKSGRIGFHTIVGILYVPLILAAIVSIYKSETPWMDPFAKAMVWVVIIFVSITNLLWSFVCVKPLLAPMGILYIVVFCYLIWLHVQASKCSVRD